MAQVCPPAISNERKFARVNICDEALKSLWKAASLFDVNTAKELNELLVLKSVNNKENNEAEALQYFDHLFRTAE